ncbi:DUF987 family protein [Aliivibrio fischeri]|uniref:DUF987 family protein n=1 Tax=Aliivibrio fischeri TaxID=668 RepID=UPI0007C5801F|nr:DUF987 family protein [Aliivibrio fischeri]
MIIISRSKAMKIAKETPAAQVIKYDLGKYQWKGSQKAYIGQNVETNTNVLALWVERRQDREGPYAQYMCLTLRKD